MYKMINGRVYFDNDTRFIPDGCLKFNERVVDVFIPKTVIYIGEQAFSGCFNLKKVIFEEESSCTFLLNNCFEFCKMLEQIILPSSIQIIGSDCFFGDVNLHEINIPKNIKHIEHHAFSASGIQQVYIDDGAVPFCDDMAFSGAPITCVFKNNKSYAVESGWNYKSYLIESEKDFYDAIIKKGLDLGDWVSQKQNSEIWYKCVDKNQPKIFGLNTDLHTSYKELHNKKNNNVIDIALSENWTLDTKISIDQYCIMSDNCWYYTSKFMEEHGYKTEDKIAIRTIMTLGKKQRNDSVFHAFVDKYIINDKGIRNGEFVGK